jgi:hypothetical protein
VREARLAWYCRCAWTLGQRIRGGGGGAGPFQSMTFAAIMEKQRKSLETNGNQWKSMKINGNQWKSKEIKGNQMNQRKLKEIK